MACRQCIVSGDGGLGRDVRSGCDETSSVLAAATILVGEFAVRQYGETSLAATVTTAVRPLRHNQWTPAIRQDAEIASSPWFRAGALPFHEDLRHIPGLHARHLAVLAGDKRLGYGKLFSRSI